MILSLYSYLGLKGAMPHTRLFCIYMSRDHNQPLQSQKKVRILKLAEEVEEELYHLSSENKGADHCTADLHLCFSIGKILVFS